MKRRKWKDMGYEEQQERLLVRLWLLGMFLIGFALGMGFILSIFQFYNLL